MNKPKGIVILGLCADDTNMINLAIKRNEGYQIWTCNDFWGPYPILEPDRAYQIHKDADAHIDEFGNQRDVTGFAEKCYNKGVEVVISDLSPETYAWFYGQQPEHWYRSTINYMFVDEWNMIENGRIGPHIILEGMPMRGTGERDHQRQYVMSAVKMSIHRGIKVDAPHWDEWTKDTAPIDWGSAPQHMPYALTMDDAGVIGDMVNNAVNSVKSAAKTGFDGIDMAVGESESMTAIMKTERVEILGTHHPYNPTYEVEVPKNKANQG